MLPDVSAAIDSWAENLTYRVITITHNDDYAPSYSNSDTAIQGVVQPPKDEELTAITVDTSLKYILVHSKSQLQVENYILRGSTLFKIVAVSNWSTSGFYRAICEEVKKDLS